MNVLVEMNSAIDWKRRMRTGVNAIVMWMVALPLLGQSVKPAYQSGTIMVVKTHQASAGIDPSVTRYDISIKVRDMVYVVLYTPPPGTYGSQYVTGMDMLVLVGDKTITYNDMLGVSREVPIVSRTKAPGPQTSH
jgi:hypothetical protein